MVRLDDEIRPQTGVPQRSRRLLFVSPGNSGANGEWKYAEDFEKLTANHHAFYLDAGDGGGNGVFRSGNLSEKPAGTGCGQNTSTTR